MWGQMAAAREGHPHQEVGTERWLRGMARRRQAGGWGKHLKPSQGRKKNSSDFHPPPHNCQKADELGASCRGSPFMRDTNELGALPLLFKSRDNHPSARYQLSMKPIHPGLPCPTGFMLRVGREGWQRSWHAEGLWKHTERWDQMMENRRVKEEKETSAH